MYIQSGSLEPHVVDDFDITFMNGLFMTITVDKASGDTVDFATSPLTTIFHMAEKPSPTDAKITLPAEDITIFMAHVLSIQHRTRTVIPTSPETRDEFQKVLQQLSSKSIN